MNKVIGLIHRNPIPPPLHVIPSTPTELAKNKRHSSKSPLRPNDFTQIFSPCVFSVPKGALHFVVVWVNSVIMLYFHPSLHVMFEFFRSKKHMILDLHTHSSASSWFVDSCFGSFMRETTHSSSCGSRGG